MRPAPSTASTKGLPTPALNGTMNATAATPWPREVSSPTRPTAPLHAAETPLSPAVVPIACPCTRRPWSSAPQSTRVLVTGAPLDATRKLNLLTWTASIGSDRLHYHSEGTTGRALTYGVGGIPGNQMTVAKCTAACANANFILAGVEYSGECCE